MSRPVDRRDIMFSGLSVRPHIRYVLGFFFCPMLLCVTFQCSATNPTVHVLIVCQTVFYGVLSCSRLSCTMLFFCSYCQSPNPMLKKNPECKKLRTYQTLVRPSVFPSFRPSVHHVLGVPLCVQRAAKTMPFQQIIMHALQCQHDLDVHLLFCVDLDLHITSSRGCV